MQMSAIVQVNMNRNGVFLTGNTFESKQTFVKDIYITSYVIVQ